MNALAPSDLSALHRSQGECGAYSVKNLARNERDRAKASRKWFSALLWRAFPSPSEADLSFKAARALDVSPRQVRNWLRCENDAGLTYVMAVMAIAGAEVVFRRIEGPQ